ncbi:oligopeptidase B [Propionicimonas paludicola]|uniref:Oligopeptidase B n=1 Tax=Propionicimonas paludicola TaxID=185243 RepID=A0A2A9CR43_9ACTN|nr:S9 family peptidase [Propionicimonas paludicola]PFG16586.1 oligopeptidase B [Propionicimonas paludicola]
MPVARPPIAPRVRSRRRRHGEVVDDYYAWMRDKQDPRLLSYLDQENHYTEQATAELAELRQSIFDDLAARTQQTDMSVPEFVHHPGLGDYWYYARTTDGLDYPSYHRCPAASRDQIPDPSQGRVDGEELLIDVQALATGSEFLALGTFAVSPNGRLAAYSVDRTGDERYQLQFLDLATGELLPDRIEEVAAGGDWALDDAFCYLTVDDAWRPDRLWRHRLGSTEPDELLLTEPDERFWLGVDASRNHRWLVVSVASKNTTECWLADLTVPGAELFSIGGRTEGLEYDVEVANDRLFIVHNRDAEDFALAEADFDCRSVAQWRSLWPGEKGVRLLGVTAYDRCLVAAVRRDGLATVTLRHRDADGNVGPETELGFDEPIYQVDADDGDEADTDRIRIAYQSMVTPDQVIEISLVDGSRRLLRARPVLDHPQLGPYRPSDYRQRREWATAADGTRVPISLVYRADTPLDGTAPCLLYGYGAYEVSVPPSFSIARLSLLDRGCVYAIAHVRGGGERGRSWYEDGRLEHKQNTFTDFLACADHLVSAGYTSRDRLGIEGGSAGGLLIGAVLNLDPGCCAAALAAVPFVDALNTILNPDLPLTVMEWEEWGDPVHDPKIYRLMRSYSPYENIRPARYPAILVTANLNDTRVEITEPAKWVARLRHDSAGGEVLLRTELVAGHGGRSGRYQAWHDIAFEWGWLLDRIRP